MRASPVPDQGPRPEVDTAPHRHGGLGVLAQAGWGQLRKTQAAGPSEWAEPWVGVLRGTEAHR